VKRVVVAVALAACVLPASAAAHARLLYSTPADGEIVAGAPTAVVLHFDDVVAVGPGNAAVDAAGRSVLRSVRARGHVLTLSLDRIGRGSYTARWSVVSDDGHTVGGVVAFAVGGAKPHATLAARGGGPAALDVLARWLLVAGVLVGWGATLFIVAVARRRRVVALAGAGFAVAAAGALLAWSRVPSGTRFAHATAIAFVAAAVGAALVRVRPRAALVPALVLVAAPSYGGHALDAGVGRVQVAVDVVHVVAAAVWVGGLASLALVLPDAAAARRFSRIALGAVFVLAATGVLRAVSELTAWSQLVHTGYGRAIAIKSVLLVALIGVAAVSRSRVRQGVGLPRSVAAELVLLAAVVTAVAFLTSLAPGRTASAPPAAAAPGPPSVAPGPGVTAAQPLRSLAVAVLVARDGSSLAVTTTVVAPTGDGVDGLRVSTGSGPATTCGRGCYRSAARPTRDLHVRVGRDTVRFALPPFPLADGRPLLRRIGARYLRARTAVFHERLSSGPDQVVTSDWRLAAPASLSFRASDGSDGVIIGPRRWDKQGGGRWIESPQDPRVPQPQLPWPAHPANVVRLPPATVGGRRVVRVSFFDPATPAWYRVSADAATDELVGIDMVAPAHFMRDDFTGLDVPLEIRPPAAR
jgi:copper transport protein